MRRDGGCVWGVCATAERSDALRRFVWPRLPARGRRELCRPPVWLSLLAAPCGLLDEVEAEVGEE